MSAFVQALIWSIMVLMFILNIIGLSTKMVDSGIAWIDYGTHCNLEMPSPFTFNPWRHSED